MRSALPDKVLLRPANPLHHYAVIKGKRHLLDRMHGEISNGMRWIPFEDLNYGMEKNWLFSMVPAEGITLKALRDKAVKAGLPKSMIKQWVRYLISREDLVF